MTVSVIFRERPTNWRFKGDICLWEQLEQVFREIKLPYNEEEFLEKLYLSIEEMIGERIEDGMDIGVDMFDCGELRSEKITYDFWMNTAIPILVDRLNKENKRIRDKYHYGRVISFPKRG